MSTSKTIYHIENMDCKNEEAQIRGRLGEVAGVHDLDFNLTQRKLTVEHDTGSLKTIDLALQEIGMKAQRQ
ncbi:hypothetical protein BH10PSE16_BH10PSE16_04860 [soil metagenome]